ncbi:MAG: hypothetical protein K9N55_13545 [Phycisphaerae bacterium]|nr:hypothetical protein [Phycisphaerae bacterium]
MLKSLLYSICLAAALAWTAGPSQALESNKTQIHLRPLRSHPDNQYYCIAGSVGQPGVEMIGLPGRVVSDASGHYQALIRKDDQPMVMPRKEGFEFNPKGKIYNHVCEDLVQQDYQCTPATYVISGSIGHADVHLKGFPSPVTTDECGNFNVRVPYGWEASITPEKEGLQFTPSQIRYARIMQDMTQQNFTAYFKTVTLSGAIIVGNCPMPGVSVSTNFGGGADTTDALGRFYIEVPYGWSGEITPFKKGFYFNPPNLTFTNVKEDVDSINQEARLTKQPAGMAPCFFDIAYRMAADNATPRNTTLIPTQTMSTQSTAQLRDDLRVVTAIMDERLGAFATHTQGIFVQDYGIILYSQVEPAFTFQGFPPTTDPSCSGDHYVDLLKDNTLKLIAYTSHIKVLDPNQWVVITLSLPSMQGNEHAMTLQVRKHDVDAFASHKMTMQEFERNVQITVQ